MTLYKYQAAGNDFILCYSPDIHASFGTDEIVHLCDRRLGIGADGLIIIGHSNDYAFSMRFYNNDGSSGMMCGNGGRCAVDFAARAGIIPNPVAGTDSENTYIFEAPDGIHKGRVISRSTANKSIVDLQLRNVDTVSEIEGMWKMNTGAEHLVVFGRELSDTGLMDKGRILRYDERFAPTGVNVDFVQICNKADNGSHETGLIRIRTYEKGVEAETLSCGTGVVASAIAAYKAGFCGSECEVQTIMNRFKVRFDYFNGIFSNVRLTGDTELVFKAEYPVGQIF